MDGSPASHAGWVLPPNIGQIYLDSNHISGTLPGDWALPSSLQRLVLWSNELTGTIPQEWGEALPDNATTFISLGDNMLTGECGSILWQHHAWLGAMRDWPAHPAAAAVCQQEPPCDTM
jgi:hypothetical protein